MVYIKERGMDSTITEKEPSIVYVFKVGGGK